MHCASITSAAFEEQYATESGAARSPATEETATIAPRCSSRSPRAACAVVRRTDDVDAMHLDERRRIDVEERARGAAAPGVQHDGVEPAEPLDGRRHGRPGGRGVGGVAGERKAVDLRGKSLERLAPSTRDRDRVSIGGEPPCGRGTDPRPPRP